MKATASLSAKGAAALMIAADQNDVATITELLGTGLSVDCHEGDGDTALIIGSSNGHEAAVHALLAAGASINWKSTRQWSRIMPTPGPSHTHPAATLPA